MKRDLLRIGVVALAAAAVRLTGSGALAAAATLAGGFPILREALHDLRRGRMTMELSMTIALVAALAIGEFFTTLVILFFVLVAELLEAMTVARGRGAIRDLLALLPRRVTVLRDGAPCEVEGDSVARGELVLVRPGERIPVDGVVERGASYVDQSAITGESMPVEKPPGARVFAGTINGAGALEVRVEALGADTAFGRICEAVERAEASRAPIERIADRLAGWLVYFALACAGFTFAATRDVRATISVILVAGACGVAAGTPLAILGAIGRAARAGAIVKGGVHMEALASVDTVLLDKTGTLTYGVPEVVAVRPREGVREAEVLEAAALAERSSEHPLAGAIRRAAPAPLPAVDRFRTLPGKGVVAELAGETIAVGNAALMQELGVAADGDAAAVLVARRGRLIGSIEVADVVRPEAAGAVRALRAMGLRTLLVTGDAEPVARAVGATLGVDEVHAGMLPEDKLAKVEALLARGRRVLMVGDGINDAPALVRATVGAAMGSGTDIARETASVALIGNDLGKLVETIRIARRCRRIVLFNFFGTVAVDAFGVALAAFGLLTPLLAALVHVGSETAFLLNSARLIPGGDIPRRRLVQPAVG
jgi:Cu+-exporting ATPase